MADQISLTFPDGNARDYPAGVTAAEVATRSLLTGRPDTDALICFNDVVAMGALAALRDLGRRVPEDVAVAAAAATTAAIAFNAGSPVTVIPIEAKLAALNPPPVRKLPILIGGTGPKRSLPAIARHADIWHAFAELDPFRRLSDRVDELAAEFGRDGADIERSTLWQDDQSADAFREAGVTLFQTELTADDGYDLSSLKQVLTWRDNG